MWNISPQVIEAVLLHHNPETAVSNQFCPLSVVHIADALLPTISSEFGGDLSCSLSTEYVKRIGAYDYVPRWRMLANGYRLKMEAAEAARSA